MRSRGQRQWCLCWQTGGYTVLGCVKRAARTMTCHWIGLKRKRPGTRTYRIMVVLELAHEIKRYLIYNSACLLACAIVGGQTQETGIELQRARHEAPPTRTTHLGLCERAVMIDLGMQPGRTRDDEQVLTSVWEFVETETNAESCVSHNMQVANWAPPASRQDGTMH